MARRIGMSAKSKNDIEQDNPYLAIGERLGERTIAHRRLDHWMWASSGEFVVAEIDHEMAAVRTSHERGTRHRHVGCHRKPRLPEHDLGLGAQRTAGEQATHALAAIRMDRRRLRLRCR